MNKLIVGLLVASLALNVGLLARFFPRSSAASPNRVQRTAETPPRTDPSSALTAALASSDRAALAALGFSSEDIRDFLFGRAYAHLIEQSRAIRSAFVSDGRYWKNTSSNAINLHQSAAQRAAFAKAQRDYAEASRAAFGDDTPWNQSGTPRLDFLSEAKRADLRRIEQDYSDMMSDIYREQDGVSLSSDEAKLKLLQQEKERDLAAALSPEEREQYELHLSPSAVNIRATYGDAIQTEDDYKKIYALRKVFDDQYRLPQNSGTILTPEQAKARGEAQKQLDLQIRAVIGEDSLGAALKANDPDRRILSSLQNRLNLPANVTDQVFASRESYAVQTQTINADASLTAEERRTQITALANQALSDLTGQLGKDAADAYAQRASWIQLMKGGSAYSTNLKEAPQALHNGYYNNVFPVQPPQTSAQKPE